VAEPLSIVEVPGSGRTTGTQGAIGTASSEEVNELNGWRGSSLSHHRGHAMLSHPSRHIRLPPWSHGWGGGTACGGGWYCMPCAMSDATFRRSGQLSGRLPCSTE
jgi:hypothetical protein